MHIESWRPTPDTADLAQPTFEGKEVKTDMTLIQTWLASLRDEDGQGLAEYALILALIAIIAIAALIFLGGQISTILSTIGSKI
jgi:pilus assembly protein Flp/PilA